MCIYVCVRIYIYREREKERQRCINIHACIKRERGPPGPRSTAFRPYYYDDYYYD